MVNYSISILVLSETRWMQAGKLVLSSRETVLFSGHVEDSTPHSEGVALMLSREAAKSLIGWELVNSRIITAKFFTKANNIKVSIIQCYAPTNDAEETRKEEFYSELQNVLDKERPKDITIVMGDFNAKIGPDNTGYENVMDKHDLGEMNENGELFADLCALNELVIGGSIYPHKDIHKATWVSLDYVTDNQIDDFYISKKFRRTLQDVQVKRGVDVASDHHLVLATLKLHLTCDTRPTGSRM